MKSELDATSPADSKQSDDYSIDTTSNIADILDGNETPLTVSTKEIAPTSKRDTWNKKIDFLVACTGYSIGLGNVWRFPYLCYKHGGGAFLIPYFTSVFVAGIPLFFLEVSLGQLMSRGGIEAWNICPILKGIGYSSIIIAFFINTYYNVLMAWILFYLFASMNSVLPWTTCEGAWNTKFCVTNFTQANMNKTHIMVDSVTEYWENRVLDLSSGIDDIGMIRWDITLCLLLAWIIIFLCIFNGIKTTSKVTYFTAISPYVLLIILLGRSVSLPGAVNGLSVFISPNWTKVQEVEVWADAGTQIFFSYAISIGSLPALGSFNTFEHNSFRDCFLFAVANTLASVLSGCVIFATLGYMAYATGMSIQEVADSGPGLAFVAYPKALSTLPISPLWSVLFFLMLFLLGLDSQFVSVEGFVTALSDLFPQYLRQRKWRQLFTMVVCLLSFLIGLPMMTNGGMYIFKMFDFYIGSRIVLVVALFECIAIGYVYGIKNYADNLKKMYKMNLKLLTTVFWCFLTPVFSLALLVLSNISFKALSYERQSTKEIYHYPSWTAIFGWTLAASCVCMIPINSIFKIYRSEGSFLQRIKFLCEPQFAHEVKDRLKNLDHKPLSVVKTTFEDWQENPF